VSTAELDRGVLRQLSSLPERLADRVGRHLAMAGRTLYEDPELAYRHALAARARAARVSVVREACGETAYAAGHFAEALTELRAARRMTGSAAYLPMMADCERALKRPARALALAGDAAVAQLDRSGQVEMAIVAAGARRDMGQVESALQLLEAEDLRSRSHAEWVARLRYAYADTLLAAGRRADAVEWFHRAVAVDSEHVTDAQERLEELGETGR
jgi:tetratricopeptide (TPR) repeat protein